MFIGLSQQLFAKLSQPFYECGHFQCHRTQGETKECLSGHICAKSTLKNRIGVQRLVVMPSKLWRFEWREG